MLPMHLPLLQIHLYLSEGCNLTCRHCAPSSASKNGKLPHFMPINLLEKAICEALPLGLQSVYLGGSATLLHPQLPALLDFLERQQVTVVFEANGAVLSPELARRLAQLPAVSVLVGLDGVDAATHDRLNGRPGQYDQAIINLRVLRAAGLQAEILFNLFRANASQVSEIVRLAETLGAGAIRFQLPQSALPQNGQPDRLQVPELIALGRKIERNLATGTNVRLHFEAPPAFRGLHPQARIEGNGRCHLLNMISVLANGQYALCGASQRLPELILGEVEHDSLADLWKSHPLLQQLRDGMPEKLAGICEHCIMKTACMGNCAVENYARSGSFWGPYWFCETAEQAGLFPAGRLIENII